MATVSLWGERGGSMQAQANNFSTEQEPINPRMRKIQSRVAERVVVGGHEPILDDALRPPAFDEAGAGHDLLQKMPPPAGSVVEDGA